MRPLRAVFRLLACVVHIVRGMAMCALVFPRLTEAQRMAQVRRWSVRMLSVFGIALRVHGHAAPGPVLLVANHVSWIDILTINAVQPARFVSKADIHRWPLLGWLVACGGTLFIERERPRDAIRVVHLMANALRAGHVLAVFPEGTTSTGHSVLPFHANLLQSAISAAAPVQAVVLRYADATQPVSNAAAYVGDTHLLQSMWNVASARDLVAHITLLPPQLANLHDRRVLAQSLQRDIAVELAAADARPEK